MSFGRADFGIVTVVFLAVYVIYLYFNNDQPINSPGKILDQITLLFAAVFFLYETRLSIGREKWRAYIAFGFIAAILSAYSAIPSLIYYFARGTEVTGSVYEMILTASLCVFITARLFITGVLIPDTVSPFATIFKMASEARSEEIAPAIKEEETPEPEEISAIDENQLTIDDALRAEEAAEDTVTDGQIPLEIALAVGTDGEIAAEIEDAAKAEEDSDTEAEEKVNAADSGNDEGIDATASEEETSVSSTKKTEEESADESDAPDNN
jgi:hypothetical protein